MIYLFVYFIFKFLSSSEIKVEYRISEFIKNKAFIQYNIKNLYNEQVSYYLINAKSNDIRSFFNGNSPKEEKFRGFKSKYGSLITNKNNTSYYILPNNYFKTKTHTFIIDGIEFNWTSSNFLWPYNTLYIKDKHVASIDFIQNSHDIHFQLLDNNLKIYMDILLSIILTIFID